MVLTAKGADGTRASLMTWHRRLGHPSFKTVVVLAKHSAASMVITDLPQKIPGLDACAACVAAKAVHMPHTPGQTRAKGHLDRVHIDIAGPMPVKSAGGKEYAYIIVDDHTRAVYMKPLKHKSDAPEAFKVFKAAAENESGRTIREVMTDNARELCMGTMKEICNKSGIMINTSVRYSPKSNGVAERTIGVLTGSVRAMLHDSGLPKFLWAEAFNTATYVHNRMPTKALEGKTPHEAIYGVEPDVSHLRAFGAPCAVVEPSELLKKLDNRAKMCFFVGYKYQGGYRVWDPKRRVVVKSRDIVFFEDGLPPPTLNTPKPPTDDDEESVVRTPPTSTLHAPVPPPPPALPLTSPPSATTQAPLEPKSQLWITVRLPGRYMDMSDTHSAQPQGESPDVAMTVNYEGDDDDEDSTIDGEAYSPE